MITTLLRAAALASVIAVGACAQHNSAPKASAPTIQLVENALATATGSFVGKSDHVTTGHASIVRNGKHWVVVLEDDFTFDGAPDPHVALGSNGYSKDASLALLSSNNGKQVYAIPDELDVANFNEIWIWCNKFNVPLGKAKLKLI